MRSLTRKLHSRRGETLVEVLASVLICALALLLLVSFATVSMRINKTAQDSDKEYYGALNNAEEQIVVADDNGQVTVTDVYSTRTADVPVKFYGGDGVYSFRGDMT